AGGDAGVAGGRTEPGGGLRPGGLPPPVPTIDTLEAPGCAALLSTTFTGTTSPVPVGASVASTTCCWGCVCGGPVAAARFCAAFSMSVRTRVLSFVACDAARCVSVTCGGGGSCGGRVLAARFCAALSMSVRTGAVSFAGFVGSLAGSSLLVDFGGVTFG